MDCIAGKFGIGQFGISRFDNDCSAVPAPIYTRNFTRKASVAQSKLDLFTAKTSAFKKKIY